MWKKKRKLAPRFLFWVPVWKNELYHHHEVRLAEVVKILGDQWKNAYETARDMTWEIDCRNWDEFPAPQKWFATGEAISHLQYLYFTGKVAREEQNGVYHYRNLKADLGWYGGEYLYYRR